MKKFVICCIALLAGLFTGRAWAQAFDPSGGLGPKGGSQPDKKEGPAEAAPEGETIDAELPPLPSWPGLEKKRVQFFEMHGYFRMRADLQSAHSLGYKDRTVSIRAQGAGAPPRTVRFIPPYPVPISELDASKMKCAQRATGDPTATTADGCPDDTLSGGNMRLRLEPTINVADTIRIHSQIDVFDNLVLGSTPNSAAGSGIPLEMFANSQNPPIEGRNSNTPAILVKRAWAEVGTPVGVLEAGRMPFQWGLGMFANDGSCLDCDFGDNVDRITFRTHRLWDHTFGMGYDFAANGPTSYSTSDNPWAFGGQAVDLEQLDDVDQWFWFAGHFDDEEVIRDRVLRGELVINYGLMLLYRYQDYAYASGVGLNSSADDYARNLVMRGGWTLTPDAWFKLRWGHLSIDLEAAFIGGNIDNVANTDIGASMSIVQFGGVARGQYRFLRDTLKIGLEIGMASGDEDEPENQDINRRRSYPLRDFGTTSAAANNDSLTQFRFNNDYIVDFILFRDVMGAVANAIYFKPSISYDIFEPLGIKMDVITSMAPRPIGYPGNSTMIGTELDFDLFYRNITDGLYASFQYGILFPFGALNRPQTLDGQPFFPAAVAGDASIAQTVQGRLVVKF